MWTRAAWFRWSSNPESGSDSRTAISSPGSRARHRPTVRGPSGEIGSDHIRTRVSARPGHVRGALRVRWCGRRHRSGSGGTVRVIVLDISGPLPGVGREISWRRTGSSAWAPSAVTLSRHQLRRGIEDSNLFRWWRSSAANSPIEQCRRAAVGARGAADVRLIPVRVTGRLRQRGWRRSRLVVWPRNIDGRSYQQLHGAETHEQRRVVGQVEQWLAATRPARA